MTPAIASAKEKGLPFKLWTRGKVRDVYDLGTELLIVASDRLSAFDVVLPTKIPDKGILLTQMSNYWFDKLKAVCPNHLVSTTVKSFPKEMRSPCKSLEGRAVLVRKTRRADVECVVRGYLAGSGWAEYKNTGAVCGQKLPKGLLESAALPEPLFTPATKAERGEHDQNINFDQMAGIVGRRLAEKLRSLSLRLYEAAARHAASRGFILADTKFEFGEIDGEVILIDEILTPDSSRFWDRASHRPGSSQVAYDKQVVRDYLLSSGWNKCPPAPALPPQVVKLTRERYVMAYEKITGKKFQ